MISNNEEHKASSTAVQAIAIFGASSAVAQDIARLHAARGDSLVLLARNSDKLAMQKADLEARGAGPIRCITTDLAMTSEHVALMNDIKGDVELDRYYIAYGVLPDQKECEQSVEHALSAINTNFNSVVSLVTLIANQMETQGGKTLAVISSVAGDRGRQSNYVYGASKGAISLFLQGVRNRLSPTNCVVLDAKPGFIDTPMTADIEKGGPLWATPKKVASDIVKAADKGKDIIYTPGFWRIIMLVIKHVPEFIFKKLKL